MFNVYVMLCHLRVSGIIESRHVIYYESQYLEILPGKKTVKFANNFCVCRAYSSFFRLSTSRFYPFATGTAAIIIYIPCGNSTC